MSEGLAFASAPRRILVARGGALGDFLVTLPSLAALRQRFPGAELHLLAHPAHAALAAADGLSDGCRSLESAGLAPFFTDAVPAAPEWRDWFASFDLVVSWLADSGGCFQRRVRACGVRHFLQGPWKFPEPEPVAQQLARVLYPLGAGAVEPLHRLTFCPPAARDILTIHPGSGSARKNWPVERWREVLRAFAPRDAGVIVITGEAESGPAMHLAAALGEDGFTHVVHSHGAGLVELCTLLSRSRLHLGHDTGISHLAAACGAPCRLIYGPASPVPWEPPAAHVSVLRTEALDRLDVPAVLTWLQASL